MVLVLASNSPRRRELLRMVGARFEVEPPRVEEATRPGEPPDRAVTRLACLKAEEVASRRPQDVVVGADTVVVLDGELLGKPADRFEAERMLRRLSGRTHHVWTGVAVVHRASGRRTARAERTAVTFRELLPREIARYVDCGEGLDKAGAYAVQGVGALFVNRIEGCYFNVVGLPLGLLAELVRPFGVELW